MASFNALLALFNFWANCGSRLSFGRTFFKSEPDILLDSQLLPNFVQLFAKFFRVIGLRFFDDAGQFLFDRIKIDISPTFLADLLL